MRTSAFVGRVLCGLRIGLPDLWRAAPVLCLAYIALEIATTPEEAPVWLFLPLPGLMAALAITWHRVRLGTGCTGGQGIGLRDAGLVLRYLARLLLLTSGWWGPLMAGLALLLAAFTEPGVLTLGPEVTFLDVLVRVALVCLPLSVAGGWLFLRVSPVLPGLALGRPLSVAEAWRSTRGMGRPLTGVLLLLVLSGVALMAAFAVQEAYVVFGYGLIVLASTTGTLLSASAVSEIHRAAIGDQASDHEGWGD